MVDTEASKASARKGMRVRVPPRVLKGCPQSNPSIATVSTAKTTLSHHTAAKRSTSSLWNGSGMRILILAVH